MATLSIGAFNKRATFKYYPSTADGAGGGIDGTPITIVETWVRVNDKGGVRSLDNYVDVVINRKEVFAYYRADLYENLPKNSFVDYNGKNYSIDRAEIVDETKKIIRFQVTAAN